MTEEEVLRGYFKADEFMAKQNATVPIRSMGSNEKLNFFAEYERLILSETDPKVGLKTSLNVWKETQKMSYRLTVFDDVRSVLKNTQSPRVYSGRNNKHEYHGPGNFTQVRVNRSNRFRNNFVGSKC
ncbi:MAG: hypothetical protein CM1200mP8_6940 [Chloroflexota bacterium]|nr:MAG: hypothetical protein CM1200mP8_6940 [Chloroflexota bacterium]